MPNRDYYLLGGAKYEAFRKAYRDYVIEVQTLAGITDAAARADREKLAALGKRVTDERDENAGANADRAREIAITGSLIRRVPTDAA